MAELECRESEKESEQGSLIKLTRDDRHLRILGYREESSGIWATGTYEMLAQYCPIMWNCDHPKRNEGILKSCFALPFDYQLFRPLSRSDWS